MDVLCVCVLHTVQCITVCGVPTHAIKMNGLGQMGCAVGVGWSDGDGLRPCGCTARDLILSIPLCTAAISCILFRSNRGRLLLGYPAAPNMPAREMFRPLLILPASQPAAGETLTEIRWADNISPISVSCLNATLISIFR